MYFVPKQVGIYFVFNIRTIAHTYNITEYLPKKAKTFNKQLCFHKLNEFLKNNYSNINPSVVT